MTDPSGPVTFAPGQLVRLQNEAPSRGRSDSDVAAFVVYVTEKCRGVPDDATIAIDLGAARAIVASLEER